jgi:hypothetical protein
MMKKQQASKHSRKGRRSQNPAPPFQAPGFQVSPGIQPQPGSLVFQVRKFNLEYFGMRSTASSLTDEPEDGEGQKTDGEKDERRNRMAKQDSP